MSETFVVAWQRLADIPAGLEGPWLIGVARNRIRSTTRRELRQEVHLRALVAARPRATTTIADEAVAVEDIEVLHRAFARLPDDEREILLLAAWDGLVGAELGLALGVPARTATARLHRARRRLRAAMSVQQERNG